MAYNPNDPSLSSNEGLDASDINAPSPALNKSFAGPTEAQSLFFIPPDPNMAVGPSNVVVTVNDAIAWYDKNGNQQSLQSLDAFFGNSNTNSRLFDARVVYDPFGGHFYAIADQRDSTNQISRIFAAESNTNDPTQGWHAAIINSRLSSGATNYWADYPTLSVDAYGLYITANYFTLNDDEEEEEEDTPQPDGVAGGSSTRLFMLDKNITTVTPVYTYDPEFSVGLDNLTLQPAIVYGTQSGYGLTGSFLVAYQQNNAGNDTLNIIKVTNAATVSSSFTRTAINVGDISDTFAGRNFAPQQGSATGIDVGDTRVYSAVWRAGILYATTEIVVAGRAVVHWFEVNTSNMTLIDQGNVTADDLGPGTNTYYGNITVNSLGQFAIGFAASNSNLHVGAYYAVHGPSDPAGTMEGTQTLFAGQNSYVALDSIGRNRWGDYSGAAVDPSDDRSFWFFNEYASSTANRWSTRIGNVVPFIVPAGIVGITGVGDFNSNGNPDFVWSDSSAFMSMWEYNPTAQTVSTTSLVSTPGWATIASAHFSNSSTSQMLMDYVPTGTMTLWWVDNGALNGIDLGQRWPNIGFISAGQFTSLGGANITNFLVANAVDHHLYDWWISPQNQLTGFDITATSGIPWANVDFVAVGQFTANGGANFLVSNNLDHHLYDWWISGNTLQGIDLGPYWGNVSLVGAGQFTANGGTNILVSNNIDHHLYDWWIGPNNALQGIDLGPYWAGVQLVTVGRFDNNTTNTQMLVQNTVDHHLYEWWIANNTLTGIDLGPYWANVQLLGSSHYNNNSPNDELLVRNTIDGHFYEWWIASNRLQGIDLGGSVAASASLANSSSSAASGPDATNNSSSTTFAPSIAAASSNAASAAGATAPVLGTATAGGGEVATVATSPGIDASSPAISAESTSLLVQAMASFGSSGASVDSGGALPGTDPSQQSALVTPIDERLAHA
jgi:hypothetical protein